MTSLAKTNKQKMLPHKFESPEPMEKPEMWNKHVCIAVLQWRDENGDENIDRRIHKTKKKKNKQQKIQRDPGSNKQVGR